MAQKCGSIVTVGTFKWTFSSSKINIISKFEFPTKSILWTEFDTSTIQDVFSHTRSKLTPCRSHNSSYTHRFFLHPQFKMQVKVSASTLQDVPKDNNSGEGPKYRLPQWLGANCEAFITTTTIISDYTIY